MKLSGVRLQRAEKRIIMEIVRETEETAGEPVRINLDLNTDQDDIGFALLAE